MLVKAPGRKLFHGQSADATYDTEKALMETGKDDWLGASFGALPNFSFGGLSDMGMPTLPDMSMKGIKFDMPAMSIPELKIPGFVLFAPAELNAMY